MPIILIIFLALGINRRRSSVFSRKKFYGIKFKLFLKLKIHHESTIFNYCLDDAGRGGNADTVRSFETIGAYAVIGIDDCKKTENPRAARV